MIICVTVECHYNFFDT